MKVPDIGDRGIKASLPLSIDRIGNILVVASRIQKLDTTCIRALEDRVPELPDGTIFMSLQLVDGGEVVDIDRTKQPATTAETSQIGS